jgi:hypothetical protein
MHCGEYVSRKQEIQHRQMAFAPYAPPPPRLPSRLRRVSHLHSDGDESERNILEDTELGVQIDQDFSRQAVQPLEDQAAFVSRISGNAIRDRWRHGITLQSDSDSDGGSDGQLPDEDSDSEGDDESINWDAFESGSGLSAWDQLGEGYEIEAAAIGELATSYLWVMSDFPSCSGSAECV